MIQLKSWKKIINHDCNIQQISLLKIGGVKEITRKPTKTPNLISWELTESGPRVREPAGTKCISYVWQLCSMVYLQDSYQWEQGLCLTLWLGFENVFRIQGGLPCTALIEGEELSPTSTLYAMLCWYPREACPFLYRNRGVAWSMGAEGRWGDEKGGEEGKMLLGCKTMNKLY